MRQALHVLGRIGNAIAAVVLVLASLYPVAWLVAISLQPAKSAYTMPTRWLFVPDFSTYAELFADPDFVAALVNTIQLTVFGTALCVGLGALAAYSLSRYRTRWSGLLTGSIAMSRVVPSFAVVLPIFFIYRSLNLLDSMAGLVLALTAFQLPLSILILLNVMNDIPKSIDEAAEIDGAGAFATFWRVILPISRPGLAATAVLTFVLIWNEFLFVLVLAGDRLITMPMLISTFQTDKQILWTEIAASSVISLLPVGLLIVLAQRHLLAGLGAGAVRE